VVSKKFDKDGLTSLEQVFCYEYLNCNFNGTEALRRAGYSTKEADSMAARVMRRPHVVKKIKALIEDYTKNISFKAEDVVKEIALVATSDISDFIEWDEKNVNVKNSKDLVGKSRCIKKLTIKETKVNDDVVERTINVELHDKMKALDILAKKWKIIGNDDNITSHVNINIDGKDLQGKSAAEVARDYRALLSGTVKSE